MVMVIYYQIIPRNVRQSSVLLHSCLSIKCCIIVMNKYEVCTYICLYKMIIYNDFDKYYLYQFITAYLLILLSLTINQCVYRLDIIQFPLYDTNVKM